MELVNKIINYILDVKGLIDAGFYFEALWNVDCIIYAAIIAWYKVNKWKCDIKRNTGVVVYCDSPGKVTPPVIIS